MDPHKTSINPTYCMENEGLLNTSYGQTGHCMIAWNGPQAIELDLSVSHHHHKYT